MKWIQIIQSMINKLIELFRTDGYHFKVFVDYVDGYATT